METDQINEIKGMNGQGASKGPPLKGKGKGQGQGKQNQIQHFKLHLGQGVIADKIGTQNNPSDTLTKLMPQSTLSKHFSKLRPAEIGIDEVSIPHLRVKLKVSAISSSSTPKLDIRTR
eukprot:1926799-Amphidinium_carterae.3